MRSTIRIRLLYWADQLKSPTGRRRSVLVWAALALWVGTEIVGRKTTSEYGDLLAAFVLVLAIALLTAAHRIEPFPWALAVQGWLRRAVESLQRWRIDVGIDLRGTPPLPQRIPDIHYARLAIVTMFVAVAFGARWLMPWREIAQLTLYTPLVIAQIVIWAICLATVIQGFRNLMVGIQFELRNHLTAHTKNRLWWPLLLAGVGVSLAIGLSPFLPPWIPVALTTLCCVVVAVALRRRGVPDFSLVWRGADRSVRSMKFHTYAEHDFLGRLLSLGVPLSLTLGTDGAIRSALGDAVAWVGSIGIGAHALSMLAAMRACHREDPSRQRMAWVHVRGEVFERDPLEVALRMRGLRLRPPSAPPQIGDVQVALRDRPARADERGWPWPATRDELSHPDFIDFLARRDAALCRSELLEAIEGRLEFARSREFRCGQGYWLAPHQWAFPGLMRDEVEANDEPDWTFSDGVVGLPWRRVLRPRARHHLYVVLKALDIDLMFVEDDVRPAAVRQVFEMLFERYDWTPHVRLEHHDLHAIDGVRLLLHQTPSELPQDQDYPELEYDDIGRARILHLFRDRTDDEETADAPTDGAREPVGGGRS